jgi:hypothetical protein
MYRWRPLRTARFRWRVDQTWTTDRSQQGSIDRGAGMAPLVSSESGETGVCLRGDNNVVRGPTTRRGHWVSYGARRWWLLAEKHEPTMLRPKSSEEGVGGAK